MNFGIHYEEVIIFKGFNEDTGEVITDKWDTRVSSIRSNFSEEDIKTILTKESYMANCYKVGGEDE